MKEIISESLNIIINGVVITDASKQDNPIIYVNNAFTKITGYKPDEVLGKNCRFLQGKDTDGEQLNKLRKAVKERKPVSVILKNYKKNKQIFWNELYISPINYKGKAYFIGIQHDVTERVRAEMRLEKYKQELELMVDQRTKKIREANSQLLKEIEENKEARKKIMLLSEKLLMYGKNINKSISESEKLNDKEQKIKQQLLTKHTTIKHLSELTNLPKSTVSTVKKRLLQKNINQVIVPNLKLFNLITLVIYRNEQPIVLPDDAFLSIKGKDSGFYLTANKTWEDFNKSQMVTNLKQPEIHHFIKNNTEIEFLGQKFQESKLNQNHAKTLYGVIKHNNTKVAAKRTEQTIQTIAKHLKELKKQGNIQTFYYEKPELLEAIELVSEEGNFLTIKNQQKTFGVNMLKGWLSIKESTEVLIPVKEASINLDFSNSIKNNYLVGL